MTNKHHKKSNNQKYNPKYHKPHDASHRNNFSKSRDVYANIPDRNIYLGETFRIFDKNELRGSDLSKSEIVIPMENGRCMFPQHYSLANLPVNVERASMQSYHIPFSREQLGAMFTAPKVVIDRWHNTYVYNGEVMHRTSFYLIAPNPFKTPLAKSDEEISNKDPLLNQTELPILYRFSVSRNLKNKEHYSISMHAILGGKEDGFLFLARLDNNTHQPHDFLSDKTQNGAFLKRHAAVPVDNPNEKQQKIMQVFAEMTGSETGDEICRGIMHRIAFPHIHQADANYEQGDEPEKSCPKFLKKCVNNSFEDNIAFMMKAFHIADVPQFANSNKYLSDLMVEKRYGFSVSKQPNAKFLMQEISVLEQCNSMNDFELLKEPKCKEKKITEKLETPTSVESNAPRV